GIAAPQAKSTSSQTLLEGAVREPKSPRYMETPRPGSPPVKTTKPAPSEGPPQWRWPLVAAGVLLVGLVLAGATGLFRSAAPSGPDPGKSVLKVITDAKADTKTTTLAKTDIVRHEGPRPAPDSNGPTPAEQSPQTQVILARLESPVAMSFPNETP